MRSAHRGSFASTFLRIGIACASRPTVTSVIACQNGSSWISGASAAAATASGARLATCGRDPLSLGKLTYGLQQILQGPDHVIAALLATGRLSCCQQAEVDCETE